MSLPRVKLNSDFTESYDHMFDVGETDFVWNRHSAGLPRKAALLELSAGGARVPYFDTVLNMYDLMSALNPLVVVYTDPFAHRGEGKEWASLSLETLQKYREDLAMLYVAQPGPAGRSAMVSYRYLRVGQKKMWLRYESDDAWRSNCGSKVEIIEYSRPSVMQSGGTPDLYKHPAIAIDYVASINGMWWAIDLNTSPGIDHTPFTEKYSATEIVDSVKEWFQSNGPRLDRVNGCPTA